MSSQPSSPGTSGASADDIEKNKGMAIAACFIFFLPLLTDAKHSPFAMHWANQSLLRLFVHVAGSVIMIIPILGWIVGFLLHIFGVVLFILSLVWAAGGQMKPLPLIGGYTILKPS
jgi:uncharacterized membrane protein